jgi:hypothetical protein
MDAQREKFVKEIQELEEIIKHTDSEYLKRDYQKQLRRMNIDLLKYDWYHQQHQMR